MTSKKYGWQKRWQVHGDGTARHETGLMVRMNGGQATANNSQQVQAALAVKHGHNAAEMIRRLLKEANMLMGNAK